jgi:exo-beta-1,3-glucanase (GH17 family)
VKKSIKQPVTVADSYDWWIKDSTALTNELDFIAVHIYPVWKGKDVEEGLSYVVERMDSLKKAFPENKIAITETGWATIATEFGDRASEEKQQRYYKEITQWAEKNNVTTFFFEVFDEDWKGNPANPFGAEKHWGLFTVDRKAKLVMHELYPDLVPEIPALQEIK